MFLINLFDYLRQRVLLAPIMEISNNRLIGDALARLLPNGRQPSITRSRPVYSATHSYRLFDRAPARGCWAHPGVRTGARLKSNGENILNFNHLTA